MDFEPFFITARFISVGEGRPMGRSIVPFEFSTIPETIATYSFKTLFSAICIEILFCAFEFFPIMRSPEVSLSSLLINRILNSELFSIM